MELCDYWLDDSATPRCDLMSSACKCGGNEAHCAIQGTSISDALKRQDQVKSKEESIRARKRRMPKNLA